MLDNHSNNKRIAKNTLLMYLRMLLIMVVSLFTSRVVLQTLGVEDFGTYNIVGGIVVLFSFINSAMSTGTQRHLSYELGKKEGDVSTIFSACLKIHFWLSIIFILLAETIGLWFLNSKMQFPEGRMDVVNWVYQFSILSCMTSIIKAPFNAAIITYERMSFFAYSSIVEVVLKLVIVYLLLIIPEDKLLVYGTLILGVSLLMLLWYAIFCFTKLEGINYRSVNDARLYKHLFSFSGWSLFGSFANVGYQQGVNIIVNLFFGVTLNAAVGVANQVNSAVSSFVTNFQQALNPQLVQSEAKKDRERQTDLIYKSSKFSFFIMLLISYPLMINLDCALTLWLGQYPLHTKEICDLILIGVLITCLSGPLWVTIYATGKIKYYQIIVSTVALSVLPVIYVGGLLGMTPEDMFFVRSLNYVFVLIVQLIFLRKYITLRTNEFSKNVIIPVLIVSTGCIAFYYLLKIFISPADSFWALVWQSCVYCSVAALITWLVGLNRNERISISNNVFNKLNKKNIC